MKSSVEALEGNKVKVVVDVDESDLEPAIDQAWKEIAKEVRLPGFRPGKAPRRLLEQQIEPGYARAEALRTALPEHYTKAVIEHDVDVIAPPELDITGGEESGDVTFEAVVEVRPTVTVAGYHGLRVEVPSPTVTDEEIDEQIDRLRNQYSSLEDVERAAADGDYVVIDVEGTRDGEVVEGLVAEDYTYLLGSGAITADFDEQLTGAEAGSEVSFTSDHPDPEEEPVDFRLSVKSVQERVLPEVTDEWISDATEFDTVEELREDTRTRLSSGREDAVRSSVRIRLGSELAKLVDDEVPDALVSSEMGARLESVTGRLGASGIGLEDYLRVIGKEADEFVGELREASEEAVRIDLALRAVAAAEDLEPTQEELEEEVASMIGPTDLSLEAALEQLRDAGQISAVRSEIANRKALEWLVERSEVVDPDGNPVPDELLQAPEPHDHDHDHDHGDHDHDHDES